MLRYLPKDKLDLRNRNVRIASHALTTEERKSQFLTAIGLSPETHTLRPESSPYSSSIWLNVHARGGRGETFTIYLGFEDAYSSDSSRYYGVEYMFTVHASNTLTGGRDSYQDNMVVLDSQDFLDMLSTDMSTDAIMTFLTTKLADAFKSCFRPEPKRGLVKAFLSPTNKDLWVYKRTNSDKIRQFEGDYYITKYLTKVMNENNIQDYVHPKVFEGEHSYKYYSGMWYHESLMVPVFHNSAPFTSISRYLPRMVAEANYEFIELNGERQFVDQKFARDGLFGKALHGYTERIESLVKPEHLFLMGKRDLYQCRDKEEVPYLGWELEACSNRAEVPRSEVASTFKAQLPNLVMCKTDSSISPEGFETVSVPATLDAWKETDLFAALDVMRSAPYNMRSFEHASCGFHVHVSRKALSILDLQKIERFMNNPANRNFLCDVAGRKSTTYSRYEDKYFNDRKSLAGSSNEVPSSGFTDDAGLIWFRSHEDTVRSLPAERTTNGGSACYRFVNNYLSFASLSRANYTVYENVMDIFRCPEQTIDLCRRSHLFALVVHRHFPGLRPQLEEIIATHEANAGTPPPAPKVKYKAGRKYSYEEAQKMPFLVGKLDGRYGVLNTSNRNTIEFRLFKGTMNPATIMRYLEFVDAIVRYVPSTSASNDGLSYDLFLNWLVNDPFNVVRYEHLVSFLIDKGHLVRTVVRKRDFAKGATDTDGTPSGVAVVKKLEEVIGKREPLIRLNTLDPLPEPQMLGTSAVSFVDYSDDEEEEYYEPEPEYDEESCDCDDCRAFRGEI